MIGSMPSSYFLVGCQRLNAAGSETVHTVAEMLGSGFAEVADPTEEIIKCIPIISGQRVGGGFFRYFDEAKHILDRQFQRAGPCFNQKIEEILPAAFELAEFKESISVQ